MLKELLVSLPRFSTSRFSLLSRGIGNYPLPTREDSVRHSPTSTSIPNPETPQALVARQSLIHSHSMKDGDIIMESTPVQNV